MSLNRYARKMDENQPAVVRALRSVGACVETIGTPVDLLVGIRAQTFLLELKDGSKAPSERRLTPLQERFFRCWPGGPLLKVESAEEALEAIGVVIRR